MSIAETNFEKLYDEKAEYVARRDENSWCARRVALEVNHYKIPYLEQVMPAGANFESIAEIGCGTGEIIADIFPDRPLRRVGFDISPENIRAARDRFTSVTFRSNDITECEESFDVVILSDVLEHVPDDVNFLASAAELADIVLVNLPLEKCWIYRNRQYGPDDSSGHLRNYSLADGFDLLDRAGLRLMDWEQTWPLEEEQEKARQRLNVEEFGHRFSGSPILRVLKAGAFVFCTRCKPIGRRAFPSNLFASAQKKTDRQQ